MLDVLAPQRNAILLLEMLDLVARVDRPDCPICLPSRTDRHIGCAAVGSVFGDGFRRRKRVVRDHAALDVGHVGFGEGMFKGFDRSKIASGGSICSSENSVLAGPSWGRELVV